MERKVNTKLKAARVLRGLRQSDLAEKLGRSQSWVCELERGLIEPSDLDVALICRVLKAKPEQLFPTESEDQPQEQCLSQTGSSLEGTGV